MAWPGPVIFPSVTPQTAVERARKCFDFRQRQRHLSPVARSTEKTEKSSSKEMSLSIQFVPHHKYQTYFVLFRFNRLKYEIL